MAHHTQHTARSTPEFPAPPGAQVSARSCGRRAAQLGLCPLWILPKPCGPSGTVLGAQSETGGTAEIQGPGDLQSGVQKEPTINRQLHAMWNIPRQVMAETILLYFPFPGHTKGVHMSPFPSQVGYGQVIHDSSWQWAVSSDRSEALKGRTES